MSLKPQISVLRTLDELETIRLEWERWPGNRDSQIDFFAAVLRSSPTALRPHVIVLSRAGRPEAMLVGRIDQRRTDFRIGYVHYGLPARVLYFVYGALRGNASADNCRLLIKEACAALTNGEADLAYLNLLNTDSALYRAAMHEPSVLRRDHVYAPQSHFSLAVPGTVNDFYNQLSPKVRKNQKWQARRLIQQFGNDTHIRCFASVGDLETAISDVERIARTSYQRALGVGFFDTPEMRERIRFKLEKGWLRIYLLYIANQPCAYWIGDLNGRTFGSEYLGFDPEFAKYSPGMYLLLKVIEMLCEEGCIDAVDFGSGNAQYKQVLGSVEWQEAPVYIFGTTPRGLVLNGMRCGSGLVEQSIKRTLGRTAMLQKVKKYWRVQASKRSCGILNS